MSINHVVREVPAECARLDSYFDCDGLEELFIVSRDRWGQYEGFNGGTFEDYHKAASDLLEGFSDAEEARETLTDDELSTLVGADVDAVTGERLRAWASFDGAWRLDAYVITDFLAALTGRAWGCISVHGYCQGDLVEVVYSLDQHTRNDAHVLGEIWLGCAKEFCVVELDEDGAEIDSCYGYIVADSQARDDDDYKTQVCAWAGIDPAETRLEMVDEVRTVYQYSYRAV